jgi:beta-galactosidase
MLPHAGTDSDLWRSVVGLGADLRALAEVSGSVLRPEVAVVLDYESWWAAELDAHPSSLLAYRRCAEGWYRAFWDANIPVDVVPRQADLDGYRVVVVPMLYLVRDEDVQALTAAVERGAHVLVTYFSGIVDELDHVRLGGYPGAFRDLLGVRTDEFRPLLEGQTVTVEGGPLGSATGSLWTEPVRATSAETVASYVDGPSAGFPAVTRNEQGSGAAWYVSTDLDRSGRRAVAIEVCTTAGVASPVRADEGVEVTVRRGRDASYVFAMNHTTADRQVDAGGTDLLTDLMHEGPTTVPAGGVVVLRRVEETLS